MSQRHILITGGSRGIGAATARLLASRGDRVAVHSGSHLDLAENLVTQLPSKGHVAVTADLADDAQVNTMVDRVVERLDGIDTLINNAGIYEDHPLTATSYTDWLDAWRRTIDINLIGAAAVTWKVADHLLHRPNGPEGGRIVMVGSRGAYRGEPDKPAYGASKAGLHAMAQSLAVALGHYGIVVTAVAPGYTMTAMTETVLSGEAGAAIRAQSPFDRVATAEDVAAAIAWLASAEARWAAGSVLDLNGASYLH